MVQHLQKDKDDSRMRKKKTARAKLKKLAYDLQSEWVRRKDALDDIATCVTCGHRAHWKQLSQGHFVPDGGRNSTKFELTNIHVQCRRCNINLGSNGPVYYKFMVEKYGQDHVDYLISLAYKTEKYNEQWFEDRIKFLRDKLNEL